MRLLLPAVALVLSTGSTAAPSAPSTKPDIPLIPSAGALTNDLECEDTRVRQADEVQSGQARRLGELPDGNLILAVERMVDECRKPVIVRYGIGGAAEPQQRQAPAVPVQPLRPRIYQ